MMGSYVADWSDLETTYAIWGRSVCEFVAMLVHLLYFIGLQTQIAAWPVSFCICEAFSSYYSLWVSFNGDCDVVDMYNRAAQELQLHVSVSKAV